MYCRKESIDLCSFSITLGMKNISSMPVKNVVLTSVDKLHRTKCSRASPSSQYVSNLEDCRYIYHRAEFHTKIFTRKIVINY